MIEHDDGEDAAAAGLDDDGDGEGGNRGRTIRGGTAGLILNKATTVTLGDVGGGVAPLLPTFSASPLHLGGDVERSSLHVVHGVRGLRGSLEVVSGVRVGGVDSAAEAVRAGRARAEDFKFLHGYCGWAPGQLEREFRSGERVFFPSCFEIWGGGRKKDPTKNERERLTFPPLSSSRILF